MKHNAKILILTLCTGLLSSLFSCEEDSSIVPSGEADILEFTFAEQTGPAVIDCSSATVHIEVENGTDLSEMTPIIIASKGAWFDNNFVQTAGDFRNPVTIKVTAEDGTTKNWVINVSEEPPPPSDATDILVFLLADQTSLAAVNPTEHTVAIEVVNGTDRTRLTPRIKVSIGATSNPESATTGDYSSAVTIAVTAEDGTTAQNWTVTVSEAAEGISSATDILSFSVPGQTREAMIDGGNHKVTYPVDAGLDLTSLEANFILSPGATSVPVSGVTGDYSSLVTIAVTAEDGTTTQDWTVDVYNVDEFDASIFCDENLCKTDDALQQECQNFLISCLLTNSGKDYDECLIAALNICTY